MCQSWCNSFNPIVATYFWDATITMLSLCHRLWEKMPSNCWGPSTPHHRPPQHHPPPPTEPRPTFAKQNNRDNCRVITSRVPLLITVYGACCYRQFFWWCPGFPTRTSSPCAANCYFHANGKFYLSQSIIMTGTQSPSWPAHPKRMCRRKPKYGTKTNRRKRERKMDGHVNLSRLPSDLKDSDKAMATWELCVTSPAQWW